MGRSSRGTQLEAGRHSRLIIMSCPWGVQQQSPVKGNTLVGRFVYSSDNVGEWFDALRLELVNEAVRAKVELSSHPERVGSVWVDARPGG